MAKQTNANLWRRFHDLQRRIAAGENSEATFRDFVQLARKLLGVIITCEKP